MGVILARGEYIKQMDAKRVIATKEYLDKEGEEGRHIVRPSYLSKATMDVFDIAQEDHCSLLQHYGVSPGPPDRPTKNQRREYD